MFLNTLYPALIRRPPSSFHTLPGWVPIYSFVPQRLTPFVSREREHQAVKRSYRRTNSKSGSFLFIDRLVLRLT